MNIPYIHTQYMIYAWYIGGMICTFLSMYLLRDRKEFKPYILILAPTLGPLVGLSTLSYLLVSFLLRTRMKILRRKMPEYARVGENGTLMQRSTYGYWRRAGQWGLTVKWNIWGKLVGDECTDWWDGKPNGRGDTHLQGIPILIATKEEWQENNFTACLGDTVEYDTEGNAKIKWGNA